MDNLIKDIVNSVFHAPNHKFSIDLPYSIIDDIDEFLSKLQYNLDYLYLNTNVENLITFYDDQYIYEKPSENNSDDDNQIDYNQTNQNIGYGINIHY